MKTKELIRQLQEADPSGEIECCIENSDVLSVDATAAYYDGALEVAIRDESLKNCCNVVGFMIVRGGSKIQISPVDINQFLFDYPDMPVGYDSGLTKTCCEPDILKLKKEGHDYWAEKLSSKQTPK